jgi:hypothetical protein
MKMKRSILLSVFVCAVFFASEVRAGYIVGWGKNSSEQATSPAGNNFITIAAGEYHSIALKSDGSIVGWGKNDYGQATPPAGNDFIAISAKCNISLALKRDGSIVGWGNNQYGQASPPAGSNYVAIAVGCAHSLALKSDGSIVGWGDNQYGQASPPAGHNYVAIAVGTSHSLALKSDGSIVGWGKNEDGEANPPAGNNYVAIVGGGEHSLALAGGDECADAIPVEVNEPYYGSTARATGTDISSCADRDTNDMWHSFRPDVNFEYTISLCGSAFDTTLAVFDGYGGTEMACNDDTEPGVCPYKSQSQLTIYLEKGSTYFIRIAGYGGQTGDYILTITGPKCIEFPVADLNKDCKVDFEDFTIICQSWLECNLDPPKACW